MHSTNKPLFYIFSFLMALVFFKSMYLSVLWDVNSNILYSLTIITGFLYFSSSNLKLTKKPAYIIAVLFALLSILFPFISSSAIYIISVVMHVFVIYLVLSLPNYDKYRLLKYITIVFSVIMTLSLVFYLIMLLGFNLPNYGMISFNEGQYTYINYGLLLRNMDNITDFYRFNSVFLEPGHIAMIASFLLFANGYRFKGNKYLIPILIALIASFSLAGYVLLVIGILLHLLSESKTNVAIIRTILLLTVLYATYYIAIDYNNGHNLINEKIIERLIPDEEKFIIGNNRTTQIVDNYYEDAVKSGEIIVGLSEKYNILRQEEKRFNGAGYKMYLLQKGVVGTLFVFLFYFFMSRGAYDRRRLFLMLLLYTASFLQRAYPIWDAWIITFICADAFYTARLNLNRLKK